MTTGSPLIVSVSGVRGIVGDSLTPNVVMEFASVFGTPLAGARIAVSRDGRSTGPMLARATIAGLLSVGCHVDDIGVASTPSCGFYVKSTGCAGGIQITASHNPPEWNGLKLFRAEGFVVSPAEGALIAERYRAKEFRCLPWNKIGDLVAVTDPHAPHLNAVVAAVDADRIRKRRFKVILDANHGSGGAFGPRLLEMLGCEVHVLGGNPDGHFEHPPEPTETNLQEFAKFVASTGSDVGFAVDPDADRLALIDEAGRYIGEEYTLALAIKHRLSQVKSPVVINGSTSRLSEDAAKAAGSQVFRSKVGEVHVAERMKQVGAVIGGEGNGGVIDTRIGFGRDSAISMALILEMLAVRGKPLSELARELPTYAIRKDKFPVPVGKLDTLMNEVRRQFADGNIETEDGIRIDWPDSWLQVRASNTEPIIRVIAEAKETSRVDTLCQYVGKITESL